MTTLQSKTALATGASRGIGRATALVLAEAGRICWFTMAAPRSRQNLSPPRSTRRADAHMPSRRTWQLRTAPHCSQSRCALLSVTGWMCSCSTRASAMPRPSRITPCRTSTTSTPPMSERLFASECLYRLNGCARGDTVFFHRTRTRLESAVGDVRRCSSHPRR